MNNGNVLNNLLGISSATSAAAKASSAKARAETSEKFQQALEQARPEVAARQPVARKESTATQAPAAARPTSKPAPLRHSQPETQRAEPRPNTQADESKTAGKAQAATESPAPDAEANTPADAEPTNTQVVEAQDQAAQDQAQDQTQDQALKDQSETLDPLANALIDPALVTVVTSGIADPSGVAAPSGELSLSANSLLNPDANSLELDEDDLAKKLDVAELLSPDGSMLLPDASLSPLAALAAGEATDSSAETLSPLMAINPAVVGQAAPGQVASGLVANAPPVVAPGSLVGDLGDKFTLDTTTDGAATEGELANDADSDSGENPDFLLLNSKAALNKLTEVNLAAPVQDQAATAADAAKPAALGAAVESLTRLTEAQSPAARAFVVQTGVPVTVGTPQWSQAVGDKVLWLAAQNVSAAEIRLDPPDLGPMHVKVSINQDQANISFTSPHPIVREALDQQLHRLREMFSEQGLNLVNVDVSDKSFAQQEREQQESTKNQANADLDEDDLVPVGLSQNLSMRLVDHYA